MSTLKKKTATAMAWDFGGTVLQQGFTFIISIILARLLDPAEFGLLGMAMVFISVSQVFVDAGFISALIQNQKNTNLTYSSVFFLNVVAGLCLTVIGFLIAPWIGQFYGNEKITSIFRWLSLIFLFRSLMIVQAGILRKELNFKLLNVRSVFAALGGGIIGIAAAFMGYGVYSLVAQQITIAFLGALLLWTTTDWRPEWQFSWHEVKKLTGFSAYVFFSKLSARIFNKLDILVIGKVFIPATLGFYTRAITFKDQVVRYSSSSITKVFYPVLSSHQDDKKRFNNIYFKVISVIAFVTYALTGILYFMGYDVIVGLFGEKWEPSVILFQILILATCNKPINGMMINVFLSKGKSKQNFYIGLLRKAVKTLPLILVFFYGLIEFVIAMVIIEYLVTIGNILFLGRHADLSRKVHFRKIFEGIFPLLIGVGMFELIDLDRFVERLAFTLGFIIFYILYNWLIKTEGFEFIISHYDDIKSKIMNRLGWKV